jgi:hypothetical protein
MGTAPVVFAADGMDVIVPLSQLGGSNGHLNFKVLTSFRPTGASPAVTVDFMPDEILPAGRL